MATGLQSLWRRLALSDVATLERPRDSSLRDLDQSSRAAGSHDPNKTQFSKKSIRNINGRWLRASYAFIDLVLVCTDGLVAWYLRFFRHPGAPLTRWHAIDRPDFPISHYIAFLLLYAVVMLLFCQSQDLYRTVRSRTPLEEFIAVFRAVFLATLLLSAFVYLSGATIVSRLVVGYAGALNLLTFAGWRLWKRRIVVQRISKGFSARNVIVIGAGRVGQALAAYIEQNKVLGYTFKGFLDANHATDPRRLGKVEELSVIAKAEFIDEVFISIPSERELVKRVAEQARQDRLTVKVVPELYDGFGWNAPIGHIGNFPVMELHWEPIPTLGLFFKRVIDVFGAALGMLILCPVMGLIGLCIKLDSPGPILYSSPRVGKKGRKFICHKFRTMVANADAVKDQLRHLNERRGPTFKITNDPRITRFGAFLRKYSLDELPQLWNVLRGEMSLVGPRPHPLDDYEQYELDHLRRLDVKPGITGLWQITARRHPSFDANMRLDLEYIQTWNLWLDLKILSNTVVEVLSGSGS